MPFRFRMRAWRLAYKQKSTFGIRSQYRLSIGDDAEIIYQALTTLRQTQPMISEKFHAGITIRL